MKDRAAFEAELERGLRRAVRAGRRAARLDRRGRRSDRLGAASALAETIADLGALRTATAERLKAIRSHNRSQRAYSDAANLGGRKQGDRR